MTAGKPFCGLAEYWCRDRAKWVERSVYTEHALGQRVSIQRILGAQRGTDLNATIGGKHHWPLQVWCEHDGVQFTATRKKGNFVVTVGKDVTPGPYLIRYYDANGTAPPRVFFVGKGRDLTEAEPNNEMLKPQSVALPAVLHGQFAKAGDVDSFAFKMKAGQTLVAAMDAYTAGVSMDALMLLRDARGVKLAFNHDANALDPRLTWKCPKDGTYVLQMACFKFPANSTSSFGGGTGLTYRVTLTNGPYLRHASPAAISGGESLIALRGWNLVNDTVRARAQENDTELVLPIEAINGPLRLPVTGRPETVEREPNDANATANASGPVNISGRIDRPGDVDRFAFDAKKGQRYRFDLDSFKLGFLLDAELAIEDNTGKVLVTNDDANKLRDPLLNWTAPADGRHCVRVRSLLNKGGGEYFYRLRIFQPEPSFNGTVEATQFVVNAGATNEVKVTVDYLDGYKGKLTVVAAALPKGVTAEPVTVEKKGTATLKLIAALDAPSHNGPLQLTLQPEGDTASQLATVSLTSSGVNNGVPQGFPEYINPQTDHLWLTVLPPNPPEKKDPKKEGK